MRLGRSVRSFGLVTLITVLVWLYAEGQDVTIFTSDITVELPAQVDDLTVMEFADDSRSVKLTVEFRGASAQLSDLKRQLNGLLVLPIGPGDLPTGVESVPLDMARLLARATVTSGEEGGAKAKTVADLGVSVAKVEPATVNARVIKLGEIDATVVIDSEGAQLSANRRSDPPVVRITAPQSLISQYATSPDAIRAYAKLTQELLKNIPPGLEQVLSSVQVVPSEVFSRSRHVHVKPATVDVTFTIESQQGSAKLEAPVPVWRFGQLLGEYRMTLAEDDQLIKDAVITGPRELIDRIRAKDPTLRVVARLDLTGDDILPGTYSKGLTQIEIHEVSNGLTHVLYSVPINPEALKPDADPTSAQTPAFYLPVPAITVTTAKPSVSYTVSQRGG